MEPDLESNKAGMHFLSSQGTPASRLQAVSAVLRQQGGQLPPALFLPLPDWGSAGGEEAALLGQEEWEAAFERAVLTGEAFDDAVSGWV